MKGCRPLTKEEVQRILSLNLELRDKVLFILGINTGYRISELLSLKVNDVMAPTGQILSTVSVKASNMKGGRYGRTIKLNSKIREILRLLCKGRDLSAPLFQSRVKGKNRGLKSISRSRAHEVLKEIYAKAKIFGSVATHTMRKTFAQNMRRLLNGDIVNLMKAMGHRSINTTMAYMSFDNDEIDSAIEQLSFF